MLPRIEWMGGQSALAMKKLLQFATALLVLAALAPAAAAQRHARRTPWIVSAPAGTRVIRTTQAQPATTTQNLIPAGSGFVTAIPSGSTVESLVNGFPVPGLGFDYTHHAAVNRNLGVRALIDPVTQQRLNLARQIRRETPVASFPFPPVFSSTQVIIVQQPPVVILQQPAAYEEPEEPVERVHYIEPPPPQAPIAQAPVVELGEIVLIRNDGTVVFAVGFSTLHDRIVYVTREGFRRSFPLRDLDVDATREMNEVRGTSLRLPA